MLLPCGHFAFVSSVNLCKLISTILLLLTRLQLRRAVLSLLHGSVCQEAASALLSSEEDYCKSLREKYNTSMPACIDPLVLRRPSNARRTGKGALAYRW
jgi:hypothetical protein